MQKTDWKNIDGAITFEFWCFFGRAIYPKIAAEMLVNHCFASPKSVNQEALETTPPYNPIHKMYSEALAHNAIQFVKETDDI